MIERLKAQLFLQSLRETDRLPPSRLNNFRAGLLLYLTEQASQSAFWRDRLFPIAGATDAGILAAWHNVPLLSLADAVAASVDRLTAESSADTEIVGMTRDRLASLADQCVFERALEIHGTSLKSCLIDLLDFSFLTSGEWEWNTTFAQAVRKHLPSHWPPEIWLETILANKPVALRAAPEKLQILVDHILQSGHTEPIVEACIAVGRPLDDCLRAKLRAISERVISIWHDPRVGILAYDDFKGSGWRISSATQFLEIITPDGRACEPEQVGDIAVTSFYNYTTPTIRFVPGDRAKIVASASGHLCIEPIPGD
jgi:hypothetical protein